MMSSDKEKTFEINPDEGAIVFRGEGVEFHYPETGPLELRETFEFLMFAMMKQEWMVEWYAHLDAAEALADLAGREPEPESPKLTIIEGGKSGEDKDE